MSKAPSLMTEQRKHALNAIDAAIKTERAALDKLEQIPPHGEPGR